MFITGFLPKFFLYIGGFFIILAIILMAVSTVDSAEYEQGLTDGAIILVFGILFIGLGVLGLWYRHKRKLEKRAEAGDQKTMENGGAHVNNALEVSETQNGKKSSSPNGLGIPTIDETPITPLRERRESTMHDLHHNTVSYKVANRERGEFTDLNTIPDITVHEINEI